jgi:Spy/CpxP family protein refolding chaperone
LGNFPRPLSESYADDSRLPRKHYHKIGGEIFTNLYPALPEFTDNWSNDGFEYSTARTVEKEKHNMKTKFWSVAVALLALVLCGTAVISSAQQNQNDEGSAQGWGGHHHSRMAWMAKELNLTDAQKAQIKTIMQSQRASLRPLMLQLEQNRQAELTATTGGAFDQAKVQALATQRSQIMAQLLVQNAQVRSQIYNTVLTADQKAKADQMQQKRLARINERLQRLSEPATPEAQ